jgi:hypothetical protein
VDDADLADEFQLFPGFAVSRPGDLWLLGYHRRWRRPPMTSSSMAPRRPPCSATRLTM